MKVLGIYGSPRPGGNSDLLLDRALEGAAAAGAEVERVYARELKMAGCRECGGCDRTGACVWEDDMQGVYAKLDAADAVIISTPMFFYAAPSQVKAVVDRGQARWNRRRLNKPKELWKNYESGKGWLIAVGATRGKNLFQGVELMARYFYDALDMSYEGGLFFPGVEGKGQIQEHEGALDRAYELGRRIALPPGRAD